MLSQKIVLGLASACAALVGLSATAANAQAWWGQDHGYGGGRYDYEGRGYGDWGGYPADSLFSGKIASAAGSGA